MSYIRFFKTLVLLCLFVITSVCKAQEKKLSQPPLNIQAKIWSKDENKQVHYSDWQDFSTITIHHLNGFSEQTKQVNQDKFGGFGEIIESTGYYHTKKINNRWWVIDPEGRRTYITAVNAVRVNKPGTTPDMFKNMKDWAATTIEQLKQIGFNTAGSWSDTASIIEYNKTATNPFAYTTQLNLLAGYASKTKKEHPERKKHSILSFILDDEFVDYCNERATSLSYIKYDPNLLGHFSDNELPFTNGEIKDILAEKNSEDKVYISFLDWIKEKGVDENSITENQKKEFIGMLAKKYYETVSKAIKKFDNNHLYLGSRIHSNAKNNKYLFEAANPYIDIISINYYGDWQPKQEYLDNWSDWSDKPFFITEFYTKAEETGMSNVSGAGWIVRTQEDRGNHYQNFCLQLLKTKNCVGWHWFRYQDNDPNDSKADESNKDSNKGIVSIGYSVYKQLAEKMRELNCNVFELIKYFDR